MNGGEGPILEFSLLSKEKTNIVVEIFFVLMRNLPASGITERKENQVKYFFHQSSISANLFFKLHLYFYQILSY
jgi:hypothetical protein